MHYWFNGWHMIWMTTHGWPQLGCYSHSSGSGLVPWVSITGGTVLQKKFCGGGTLPARSTRKTTSVRSRSCAKRKERPKPGWPGARV